MKKIARTKITKSSLTTVRDKILDTVEDYLFTRDNENIPITFREWENIKKEVGGIPPKA